jgi:hypothetical protein
LPAGAYGLDFVIKMMACQYLPSAARENIVLPLH